VLIAQRHIHSNERTISNNIQPPHRSNVRTVRTKFDIHEHIIRTRTKNTSSVSLNVGAPTLSTAANWCVKLLGG